MFVKKYNWYSFDIWLEKEASCLSCIDASFLLSLWMDKGCLKTLPIYWTLIKTHNMKKIIFLSLLFIISISCKKTVKEEVKPSFVITLTADSIYSDSTLVEAIPVIFTNGLDYFSVDTVSLKDRKMVYKGKSDSLMQVSPLCFLLSTLSLNKCLLQIFHLKTPFGQAMLYPLSPEIHNSRVYHLIMNNKIPFHSSHILPHLV